MAFGDDNEAREMSAATLHAATQLRLSGNGFEPGLQSPVLGLLVPVGVWPRLATRS